MDVLSKAGDTTADKTSKNIVLLRDAEGSIV